MRKVMCPYCKNKAELISSEEIYNGMDFGMIWICRPCGARVSVHKNSPTYAPHGTLAKPELMELRKKCHNLFDELWKSGKMSRDEAYSFLAKQLGVSRHHAHIGYMGIKKCKQLIRILEQRKT